MSWSTFLTNVTAVAYITANVIIMFHVFPAYRQTRRRAFLLIWCACLMGTFDTIWDHTFAQYPMAHEDYVLFRTIRRLLNLAGLALETTGIVLLVQDYLRLAQPKPGPPPESDPS